MATCLLSGREATEGTKQKRKLTTDQIKCVREKKKHTKRETERALLGQLAHA